MPIRHDDPTPNPDAVPTTRELFTRLIALERKFTQLHDAVAKFTSDAAEEMDDVDKRLDSFAAELADLKQELRKGHGENNGLLQGLARAFERIEAKLDARLAAEIAAS